MFFCSHLQKLHKIDEATPAVKAGDHGRYKKIPPFNQKQTHPCPYKEGSGTNLEQRDTIQVLSLSVVSSVFLFTPPKITQD